MIPNLSGIGEPDRFYAEIVYDPLKRLIVDAQSKLQAGESLQVLVPFRDGTRVTVTSFGYQNPNFITALGLDSDQNPVTLLLSHTELQIAAVLPGIHSAPGQAINATMQNASPRGATTRSAPAVAARPIASTPIAPHIVARPTGFTPQRFSPYVPRTIAQPPANLPNHSPRPPKNRTTRRTMSARNLQPRSIRDV